MNHSGTENQWSKAFSVDLPGEFFFRPVAFLRNGKEVLLEMQWKKLVWYDIERKTLQNFKICGFPTMLDSYLYTESFLQLIEDMPLQKPSQDKYEKQKKR